LPARLVSQGTGDEGLAGPGRPADEHVLMLRDPAAGGELADQGLIPTASSQRKAPTI